MYTFLKLKQKANTICKNAYFSIDNFLKSLEVILKALGKNLYIFQVGTRIRIIEHFGRNAFDKSYLGDELIVKEVQFPFIYVEVVKYSSIFTKPVKLDIREYAIQKY